MHFSRMLTAVVVTCATGALAAQLTATSASNTIEGLYRLVEEFTFNIQASSNDAGDVILSSLYILKNDIVNAAIDIGTMTETDTELTESDGNEVLPQIYRLTDSLTNLFQRIGDRACRRPDDGGSCDLQPYMNSIGAGLESLRGSPSAPTGASPRLFYNRVAAWFASDRRTKAEIDRSLQIVENQLAATRQLFNEPN